MQYITDLVKSINAARPKQDANIIEFSLMSGMQAQTWRGMLWPEMGAFVENRGRDVVLADRAPPLASGMDGAKLETR